MTGQFSAQLTFIKLGHRECFTSPELCLILDEQVILAGNSGDVLRLLSFCLCNFINVIRDLLLIYLLLCFNSYVLFLISVFCVLSRGNGSCGVTLKVVITQC